MKQKSSLCRHFPSCGGCESLHVAYSQSLKMKERSLRKIFASYKGINISPVLPSHPEHHYRHKVQLPIGRSSEGPVIGLLTRDHRKIISLKECYIQHPHLTLIGNIVEQWSRENGYAPFDERKNRGTLRHLFLRRSSRTGGVIVGLSLFEKLPGNSVNSYAQLKSLLEASLRNAPTVKTLSGFAANSYLESIVEIIRKSKGNMVLAGKRRTIFGKPVIEEQIGAFKFNLKIDSFFQTNPFQIEPLYDIVKKYIEPDSNIIDLFSGMGTIGLFVSDKAKSVVCLEQNQESVKSGKEAIVISGKKNVHIERFDAGKYLLNSLRAPRHLTGIILDPPREGLSRESVIGLLRAKVKYIIYVSCNPITLERDAVLLQNVYHLTSLEPVDMFPYTDHLETVAVFYNKERLGK